jgi:hypothetical protein
MHTTTPARPGRPSRTVRRRADMEALELLAAVAIALALIGLTLAQLLSRR